MANHKGNHNSNFKHGLCNTRLYKIWGSMIQRVSNTKNKRYYLYGGKGVKVSPRWLNFINFYNDMKESYDLHVIEHGIYNTTLDRIKSDLNYELSNCRWATKKVQRMNSSYVRYLEYNGVTLCMKDWCRILSIPMPTMTNWLDKYNRDFKDIASRKFEIQPVGKKYKIKHTTTQGENPCS